jgi:putative ABC transport system permease protein
MSVVLILRRARRDLGLLGLTALIAAVTVFLACSAPRLVQDTVDRGAREAVATAGRSADLVLGSNLIADLPGTGSTPVTAQQVIDLAPLIPERLPPALRSVAQTSLPFAVTQAVDVVGAPVEVGMRFAALTPDGRTHLVVERGELPGTTSGASDDAPIEVALSAVAARSIGADVGSVLRLETATDAFDIRVSALVAPDAGETPAGQRTSWIDIPNLWPDETDGDPVVGTGRPRTEQVSVLIDPEAMTRVTAALVDPVPAGIRVMLDPGEFTADAVTRVAQEIEALKGTAADLTPGEPITLLAQSSFEAALADYPPAASAATAQMTIAIAGMLVAAITVLLLASALLTARRAPGLTLERARGTSLVGIGCRAGVEVVVTTAPATVVGVLAAGLVFPGPGTLWWLIALVGLVAVAVPVVQAVRVARAAWPTSRRVANPSERRRAVRMRARRRLVLEALLGAVTLAAVLAVVQRGALPAGPTGGGPGSAFAPGALGVDPLVAVAPALIAASVAVAAARLLPLALRPALRPARRSRGIAGLLITAQLERTPTLLPVFAATLAVGILFAGGSFAATVDSGQENASWSAVGGDARADGSFTPDDVTRVQGSPDVTAAGARLVLRGVDATGERGSTLVSVTGVTAGSERLIGGRPDDPAYRTTVTDIRSLRGEDSYSEVEGPVRALADAALIERYGETGLSIEINDRTVDVELVAPLDVPLAGQTDEVGSRLLVDLDALSNAVGTALPATTIVVDGAGAASAVASLGPDAEVETRAGWLAERRGSALIAGTTHTMQLAAGAAFVLAMLAVAAAVLGQARGRVRDVALMRTLGAGRGAGWWLAFAQTLPVALAAFLGGVGAGALILYVVGPSLGLDILTGREETAMVLDQTTLAVAAAGIILTLAAAILGERIAASRRALPTVLRVGESS